VKKKSFLLFSVSSFLRHFYTKNNNNLLSRPFLANLPNISLTFPFSVSHHRNAAARKAHHQKGTTKPNSPQKKKNE